MGLETTHFRVTWGSAGRRRVPRRKRPCGRSRPYCRPAVGHAVGSSRVWEVQSRDRRGCRRSSDTSQWENRRAGQAIGKGIAHLLRHDVQPVTRLWRNGPRLGRWPRRSPQDGSAASGPEPERATGTRKLREAQPGPAPWFVPLATCQVLHSWKRREQSSVRSWAAGQRCKRSWGRERPGDWGGRSR